MKFGKEFTTHLEETLPEWRDKFLCYKPLKKLLKRHFPNPTTSDINLPLNTDTDGLDNQPALLDLQEWFIRILKEELDKFNNFYVNKEEEFVIRFQVLKERIDQVMEKSSNGGVFTSESEFSEETMEIRKDFVTIHGEMVLLKNYSSLNFAGLVKILKKYDKRTGGLLRLPFTQFALRQPFFTTEHVTRLVRGCEEKLELLFPLEAEVIESNSCAQDQSKPPPCNATNISPETSSTLGEESVDLYRGTLAAMKAIKGLQKASSTSNPWSLSSHFRNQDDEGTGAVTAENSSASLNNGEESDQEDYHSV
ncbi:hypothetical protein FH972_007584 [Carpinus fangiana]|uniref:SPX domain-containing protein n=1 Tax=Carpinus fangiana TaxID=176857 RepID=A0A5N6QWX7_9ROSI|nr:hypothetical protein FH972_007584 [Carpinus fangiana]